MKKIKINLFPHKKLSPQRLSYLIAAANTRWSLDRTCLSRSLLLWWWLQNRNIESEILMGFKKVGVRDGHAWVEINGEVINDKPNMRELYAVLEQIKTNQI